LNVTRAHTHFFRYCFLGQMPVCSQRRDISAKPFAMRTCSWSASGHRPIFTETRLIRHDVIHRATNSTQCDRSASRKRVLGVLGACSTSAFVNSLPPLAVSLTAASRASPTLSEATIRKWSQWPGLSLA
jgi:hypothetical protein